MNVTRGQPETSIQAARRRMRHGRMGRSMLAAAKSLKQPSRESTFAQFAFVAFEELREIWPGRLGDVQLHIVMAPNPNDKVIRETATGNKRPVDWRIVPEVPSITLFRARIENSVRNHAGPEEPFLLQLEVEEALCRAVAEYLGIRVRDLLRGEQ